MSFLLILLSLKYFGFGETDITQHDTLACVLVVAIEFWCRAVVLESGNHWVEKTCHDDMLLAQHDHDYY